MIPLSIQLLEQSGVPKRRLMLLPIPWSRTHGSINDRRNVWSHFGLPLISLRSVVHHMEGRGIFAPLALENTRISICCIGGVGGHTRLMAALASVNIITRESIDDAAGGL